MTKNMIPLAAMEKLLKEFGSQRVSQKAKAELKKELEKYAFEISEKSVRFAAHAGRKTVKSSDVSLASK